MPQSIAKIDNDLALISTEFTGFNDALSPAIGAILTDNPLWQWSDGAIGITVVASSSSEILASDLGALGMLSPSIHGQLVSGFLPTTSIAALTALESLRFAHPALDPISYVGLVTSGGDVAQRSQLLHDFAGLTGEGVRVGVVSDSYDNGGAGSAATDIASGDLPGTGNPNGFTTPV
jgi:hypothetical protein